MRQMPATTSASPMRSDQTQNGNNNKMKNTPAPSKHTPIICLKFCGPDTPLHRPPVYAL